MRSENYDNPKLMISGRNRDRFDLAIQLSDTHKAVGWSEEMMSATERDHLNEEANVKTLVFYWTEPTHNENFNKFPVPLDPKGIAELAWQWLDNLTDEDYEPTTLNDFDVEEEHGWLVFTKMWGHVTGWESSVGVQPYSCWIGK